MCYVTSMAKSNAERQAEYRKRRSTEAPSKVTHRVPDPVGVPRVGEPTALERLEWRIKALEGRMVAQEDWRVVVMDTLEGMKPKAVGPVSLVALPGTRSRWWELGQALRARVGTPEELGELAQLVAKFGPVPGTGDPGETA